MRDNNNFSKNMKCQICNTEQTIRSMAMHLKHNHNILRLKIPMYNIQLM